MLIPAFGYSPDYANNIVNFFSVTPLSNVIKVQIKPQTSHGYRVSTSCEWVQELFGEHWRKSHVR
jgi:hypothetical protein